MMKKALKAIALVLCIIPIIFVFAACSDAGAPEHNTADPTYVIAPERITEELEMFVTENKGRTSFSASERSAAAYLNERLVSFGYAAEIYDFTTSENGVSNLTSQNVVARYGAANAGDESVKNVVLGAYYDNRYAAAYKGATAYGAESALGGGTGVATLLAIADYLQTEKIELDFDVTIVFFGASFASDVGAQKYYDEQMTPEERRNTVLMVELQRLGVDHVYAFSDARETSREQFFDRIAAKNGLDIYKTTQRSPLITSASALKGVPYFQWAHSGIFGPFFDAGIPTLNLVGANWETYSFNNNESYKHDNITYTERDTLSNLLRLYPDCGSKMATAATLVIQSLTDDEFINVMSYDKCNFPDTSVLTMQWIWYLVVVCVVIVAAGALMFVNAHITKKYPIEQPKPLRMKMAVFGMDYEDKSSSDVFIDIKPADGVGEEIFPGIANNAPHSADPIDDIFPPLDGDDGNSK